MRFSWSGAEPRIIEQEATSKLEALFARVNGIRKINPTPHSPPIEQQFNGHSIVIQ
ncbi:MAG: hypothetical protein MUE91_03190 [Ignavibacteriaceae bacterium]|nr:hypothetical protein [Ignavibacteriaceae bacterium]